MEEEPSPEEVLDVMMDILKGCRVITVATEADGKPWATTMFFGVKELDIYCVVEDRGHGMANIRRNPNVGFAIDNRVPDRFVQGIGDAEVIEEEGDDDLRAMVIERVPEYKAFFEMTETSLVRISIEEVFITDVTRGWFPAKSVKL